MIRIGAQLSRTSSTVSNKAIPQFLHEVFSSAASSFRSFNNCLELDKTMENPSVFDVINHVMRQARTNQSVASCCVGLKMLKLYLSTKLTEDKDPQTENSKGITLLATSTLMSERGEHADAIETLQSVHELTNFYMGIRVAAFEAQAGLHLELGQDVMASEVADKCIEFVEKQGHRS